MSGKQKQKKAEAPKEEAKPVIEKVTPEVVKAEAPKEEAKKGHEVAAGKSITSKKGVLSEGDEVKAEYLGGGQDALDKLVLGGFVTKG